MVGFSNALVDFAVFDLLIWMAPTRDAARLVGYNTVAVICALANSYRWNSTWTFRDARARGGRPLRRQRILYTAQSALNVVVNNAVLAIVTVILNTYELLSVYAANNLAKLLGVVVAWGVSFAVLKWLVFRGPEPPGQALGAS